MKKFEFDFGEGNILLDIFEEDEEFFSKENELEIIEEVKDSKNILLKILENFRGQDISKFPLMRYHLLYSGCDPENYDYGGFLGDALAINTEEFYKKAHEVAEDATMELFESIDLEVLRDFCEDVLGTRLYNYSSGVEISERDEESQRNFYAREITHAMHNNVRDQISHGGVLNIATIDDLKEVAESQISFENEILEEKTADLDEKIEELQEKIKKLKEDPSILEEELEKLEELENLLEDAVFLKDEIVEKLNKNFWGKKLQEKIKEELE